MVTHATHMAVTPEERQHFDREGYVVLRDLLARAEVQELLDTMMDLQARGPIPQVDFYPVSAEEAGNDILKQYPATSIMNSTQPRERWSNGKRIQMLVLAAQSWTHPTRRNANG